MTANYHYHLTGHACRRCLHRILVRQDDDGNTHVRCSMCGAEATGDHEALCCCGVKLKTGKDAGLRCVPNPAPSREVPDQVVVQYVGLTEEDLGRTSRRVRIMGAPW